MSRNLVLDDFMLCPGSCLARLVRFTLRLSSMRDTHGSSIGFRRDKGCRTIYLH